MAKNTKRTSSRVTRTPKVTTVSEVKSFAPKRNRLKCKNRKQKEFANLINKHEIIIASGPAGTGKSYISIAKAIELVQNQESPYKKIIISKPAVEAGEKHGFMPGDMKEKMEPYVASSVDIIDKILGKSTREKLVENGIVQIEALAFIRGKTVDNTILIMEEAQNMSPNQVKTLLTRIGENSKFIISGDIDQSDKYRDVTHSGLYDVMNRHRNIKEIGFFEFGVEDIVRNPIISKILKNYNTTSTAKETKSKTIKVDPQKVIKTAPIKKTEKSIFSEIKSFLSNIF